jgi:tetratricopeptide (TPR) repeat protein
MVQDDGRGPALTLEESSLPDEGTEPSPLFARLAAAEATLERERAEAPLLCRLLLAHPPELQPEVAAGDPRFHTWGVGEQVLAWSLEAADAVESERLATLALVVARCLDRHPAALVRDLEARAWAFIGRARLRQGDLAGAGEALRAAAACLAQGTGDLLVESLLLEFEADFCQAQGRRGEAAALLHQAASRYEQAGDIPQSARLARRRDQLLRGASPAAVPGLGRR